MSIVDALNRISQIQQQIVQLQSGQAPNSSSSAATANSGSSGGVSGVNTNFATALAQAQSPGTASAIGGASDIGGTSGVGGPLLGGQLGPLTGGTGLPITGGGATTALPAKAASMMTSGQQAFASRLAADTGMNPGVISAWLLAEENGGAAQSRQAAGNNDWLNIGYTDSGTYGSAGSQWSDPVSAADATAGWLKGQNTIPGYGTASAGVQSILSSVGQTPAAQIAALQSSGWASSGYPDLPALYAQVSA